jgi:serine phosphatase RsbU (regulator of sigma subunit)
MTGQIYCLGSLMAANEIKSHAFRSAELRSERVRILGLLAFLAITVTVLLIRVLFLHTTVLNRQAAWTFGLIVAAGLVEFLMFHLVNQAIRKGRTFPTLFWVLTTILESALPAVGIAFLTSGHLDPAYQPLASPATLFFFIFIILSILRLNPRLCWLSGITATITYLLAAVHLGWSPPVFGTPAPITQTDVTLYAIILLLAGFVAGGVAKEIRKHVEAALREAETQQQLAGLQHDLQTAREIQQSLLPHDPPALSGFAIAGWNKPADDTGGDYYDWCPLPDGRWIVTLADVTGHGIGPALIAAACRAYSRASFRTHSGLPQIFSGVNDALTRDLDPTRFVTFVGAVCEPATGEVEVLSAGHGPLFLYSAGNDSFTEVDSQGVPFGILPEFTSGPPARLSLLAGDLFLLITDGFVEWENDQGELFGSARLQQAVRASRDLLPEGIIKGLYDAVTAFSRGTKQQDDLTVVIIKRT